jgi:trans-aconitate 2-methyltransferase
MSSPVANYYDEFTTQQLKEGANDRHIKILEWVKKYTPKKTDTILVIGCGIGIETQLLASLVKRGHITATDISPESIEIAKQKLKHLNNVTLIAGDIIELDIKGKFDFIILPDVLEHIPIAQHSTLFKKLKSLLKDSGIILIHIPNPYNLQWDHIHDKDSLQIIDQPIYTNEFVQNAYPHGLYIHYLETYSIWKVNNDYQVIVLRPYIADMEYSSTIQKPVIQKIIARLKFKFQLMKANGWSLKK